MTEWDQLYGTKTHFAFHQSGASLPSPPVKSWYVLQGSKAWKWYFLFTSFGVCITFYFMYFTYWHVFPFPILKIDSVLTIFIKCFTIFSIIDKREKKAVSICKIMGWQVGMSVCVWKRDIGKSIWLVECQLNRMAFSGNWQIM